MRRESRSKLMRDGNGQTSESIDQHNESVAMALRCRVDDLLSLEEIIPDKIETYRDLTNRGNFRYYTDRRGLVER